MARSKFGAYLKALRLSRGFGLREFAEMIEELPANLSAVEHGRRKPWREREKLMRTARALALTESSTEWNCFFDLARQPGSPPADVDETFVDSDIFPVLCRTVQNAQLSEQEILHLVDYIKKHRGLSTNDAN